MLISDLEDLEDILDTLVFEDPPTIFDEDSTLDLIETALHLMEEYILDNPTAITEPDFNETLLEEIKDIFYIQFEDLILKDDYVEDDLDYILVEALNIYISTFHTERSMSEKEVTKPDFVNTATNENNDLLEEKISALKNIPQPTQRTDEWYKFRWNLITASNAWKAFESQSTINQLIYEKCQPLTTSTETPDELNPKIVNTNTPLHWGQKYEPLSVMIYEKKYNTQVGDFGCIPHPTYKFLGASPDGINIDPNSDRYGRMLEIKNVVSREITGIPKKEYWIQMQLQMEVCDLDECDFLETKFTEYPDYTSYENDITTNDLSNEKTKGIIIHFHKKDGAPFYVYKPIDITKEEDIEKWEDDTINLYQSEPYNYIYLKFIYWKLERFSCVLVLRNKDWFKNNIPQLQKVWKIIEEERVTGYEHRAPNKKVKKEQGSILPYLTTQSSGCLLKFNKIIKIDPEANNS